MYTDVNDLDSQKLENFETARSFESISVDTSFTPLAACGKRYFIYRYMRPYLDFMLPVQLTYIPKVAMSWYLSKYKVLRRVQDNFSSSQIYGEL